MSENQDWVPFQHTSNDPGLPPFTPEAEPATEPDSENVVKNDDSLKNVKTPKKNNDEDSAPSGK